MKKTLVFTAALLLIPPQAFCLSLGDIFTEVVNQATQTDTQPKQETPAPTPVAPPASTQTQESGGCSDCTYVESKADRMRREQAEKDRQEKLANEHQEQFARKSNIPKERLLIWEDVHSRIHLPSGTSSYAHKLILDTVNKYAESEVDEATAFVTPRKSEFEKQADYDVRLRKAQSDFNSSEVVANTNGYRFKMIQQYFSPMVGVPELSAEDRYFKYDADKEILTLIIRQSQAYAGEYRSEQTETPVVIKNVSPEIAKAFKTLSSATNTSSVGLATYVLPCIAPHVGMEWSASGRLTAKYVVLDFNSGCGGESDTSDAYKTVAQLPESHPLKAGVAINHQYPIVFGKETANNYDKTIAAAEQAAKRQRAENDKAKIWYPLHSKIKDDIYECKVIKDNIAGIAMTSGDKAAYDAAVNYKNRYAVCFR